MARTFQKPDHCDGHRPVRPSTVAHAGQRSVGTHKYNAARGNKVAPHEDGTSASNAAFNKSGQAVNAAPSVQPNAAVGSGAIKIN
jgi:hypothetical protein